MTRHLSAELSRDDWEVLILHYLGLDHIGHLAGPASPLLPRKLSEMSRVMESIYSGLGGSSQVGGERLSLSERVWYSCVGWWDVAC